MSPTLASTPLRFTLLAALLHLVLLLPVSAQDATTQRQQPAQLPRVRADALGLAHFRPEHSNPHELANLAQRLFGRSFLVETDDGVREGGPVQSIQQLGETVLVFDAEERVGAVLAHLKTLDRAGQRERGAPDASYEVLRWTPRHAGLQSAVSALQGFQRTIQVADENDMRTSAPNLTWSQDANLLVVRETPDNLASIRGVLEELDRPAQQLMVSALVIEGREGPADGAGDPAVPEVLRRNLSMLLPFERFEVRSMGVVRSSVAAASIDLEMPGSGDEQYELRLRPTAFDADGGVMTAECQFSARDDRNFRTTTRLPTGEYTVLGATGATPLFVVVRLVPLGEPTHAATDGEALR